ncbi:MAG: type III-B CRISPR module RAMP protein Cmr1 [Deltaproteobacteria bacterium]|nr:type III-B CRISPR module RAMP protein Cmr1 [Deltaproteobacteria bacterium]
MKIINCKFEVVTPMFLSGADNNKAEIRAPSIKGLLRFWWRAIVGAKLKYEKNEIKDKEERLFGTSLEDKEKKKGASKFSIKITKLESYKNRGIRSPKLDKNLKVSSAGHLVSPIDYLGYGVYLWNKKNKAVETSRAFFDSGTKFNISFIFSKPIDKNEEEEFLKALWGLVNFGGLGSRSRKGFGSTLLLNRKDIFAPLGDEFTTSLVEPKLIDKIKNSYNGLPPYTGFSKNSIYLQFKPQNSWQDALALVGKYYITGRKILPTRKRIFLGYPLSNIKFDNKLQRRASPYFIHVAFHNNSFVPTILYLPARFSPTLFKDEKINEVDQKFLSINQRFLNEISKYAINIRG